MNLRICKTRWELFESQLRASSLRASLQRFESFFRRSYAEAGRPFTASQLKATFTAADAQAQQLLSRLLVGLDRSLVKARKEATKDLQEVKKRLAAENAASIKGYIRKRRDHVLSEARPALEEYQENLPMPTKKVEEWSKAREAELDSQLKQMVVDYREDPSYTFELKELSARVKAECNTIRLKNAEALEGFFDHVRGEAVQTYKMELDKRVNNADFHLPEKLVEFHKECLPLGLGVLEEGAKNFKGEKALELHEAKARLQMGDVFEAVRQGNSVKIRGFCHQASIDVAAGITTEITRLGEILDEQDLEAGLANAKGGMEVYRRKVGGYAKTDECMAVEKELLASVEVMQDTARRQLAEKIKRVLREPLNEICKRVIESKCSTYGYVKAFTADVHKECGYFVRRHEVGAKLSNRMLARVIDQFIVSDLTECKFIVEIEEKKRNFYRHIMIGVSAVIAIPAFFGYLQGPQPARGRRDQVGYADDERGPYPRRRF